jgi:formimidoylglutamate deiminase
VPDREPERAAPAGPQTLWFEQALLADGWARDVRFTISDGMISRVDTDVARQSGEVAHGPCLPGLPNLHSHAFQRAMAGLTETRGPTGDSFWTWRELMYRFVDRLGPDEVQAIAALAYMEMLETGSTRVGEFHYLHHDKDGGAYADPAEMAARIAAAAEETGIGLTLLPVFYAHAGFGGVAPGEGQRRFIHDVDSYGRLIEASRAAVSGLPDAVVGVAPHSLRAVTGEELTAIIPLAGANPIHIHIAEQTQEVDDCLAATGARPVRWLMNNAPVDKRWCLVHATHLNAMETERLAKSGAVAGLCPITEANLGDGVFPAHDYLAAGGAFGIGSDSNVLIDAAEELRTLEYAQRLTRRARNVLAKAPGLDRRRAVPRGGRWRGPGPGRGRRPAPGASGRLRDPGPRPSGDDRPRRRRPAGQLGVRRATRGRRRRLARRPPGRQRRSPSRARGDPGALSDGVGERAGLSVSGLIAEGGTLSQRIRGRSRT